MVLPLLAVVYIGWHVWAILPVSRLWKTLIVMLMVGCFLLLFFGLRRQTDNYSLPVAQVLYEVGTSSVFILLYLVIIFLVLDLGRLVHLVQQLADGSGHLCVAIRRFPLWQYPLL